VRNDSEFLRRLADSIEPVIGSVDAPTTLQRISEERNEMIAAFRRFEPVLVWLENCGDNTVGADLAKQLRPRFQAVIQKADAL